MNGVSWSVTAIFVGVSKHSAFNSFHNKSTVNLTGASFLTILRLIAI